MKSYACGTEAPLCFFVHGIGDTHAIRVNAIDVASSHYAGRAFTIWLRGACIPLAHVEKGLEHLIGCGDELGCGLIGLLMGQHAHQLFVHGDAGDGVP